MHKILLVPVLVWPSISKSDNSTNIAYKMHQQLAREPADRQVLREMSDLIKSGDKEAAAAIAIQNEGFYSCTLKNWCLPQTNEAESKNVEFNDYCATVIGAARDDIPFTELLYSNILYISEAPNVPAYEKNKNDHYKNLIENGVSLVTSLKKVKQTDYNGISKSSGLLTTRAFAEAFLSAGTNRRAVRHSIKNFNCTDIEEMMDTSITDRYVGQDVDRSPGGKPNDYQSQCKGCHTGMDSLRGAFAYYDYDETKAEIVYNASEVHEKYSHGSDTFKNGYVTKDDSWENLWVQGINKKYGWSKVKTKGKGLSSYGKMLSKTKNLSTCLAKRSYEELCILIDDDSEANEDISEIARKFEESNYNLKTLFSTTAAVCLGGE